MKNIYVLLIAGLAGCSFPQENNYRNSVLKYAEVVDADSVSNCQPVERVVGKNKRNGELAPTGEIIALKIVTSKAYSRGGTHVVIEDTFSTDEGITIKGQAYDCSEKAKSELANEPAFDNLEELDPLAD